MSSKPQSPAELNALHRQHYTQDGPPVNEHVQAALSDDEAPGVPAPAGPRQYRLVARLSKERYRIVDAKGHFHIYDSHPDEEERDRRIMNDSRYPMPQRIAALRRVQDRANGRRSW